LLLLGLLLPYVFSLASGYQLPASSFLLIVASVIRWKQ
jgi:hypothetical protein